MERVEFSIAPLDPSEVESVARAHAIMQAALYAPIASAGFTDQLFSYMDERIEELLTVDVTAVAKTPRGGIVGVAMVDDGPHAWELEYDDEPVPPATYRYLATLFTMPGTHGSGLGAALLNTVLPDGEGAYLWTMVDNPRAIRFYEKHGFAPDGFTRNTGSWGNMDMIRMVRL